jgi:hypothetical protein
VLLETAECDGRVTVVMSGHRLVAALAMAMAGGLLSSPPASAAAADPVASDSAVMVSGTGDFANLKVTVSQTKNLINQTVTVSWTGGTPTVSDTAFALNYLQIMQCWGDDPAGPDRTQCQFGASRQGVGRVGLRQLSGNPVDPKETLKLPAGSLDQPNVPFWAVDRPKPTGAATSSSNDFFDAQVTNEIPQARTHGDGSGEEFFEVETARQAAGLGCGEPVITAGSPSGRSCWLVIVPRSNKEVDGSIRTGQSGQDSYLQSSPLSQSNWDNRLVIPLEFQTVGQACPIGAPERPVIGHELVVDAVSSWQPALCAGGGTLFSYTQLTDDVARSQVQDGGLALVTNPVPPDQVKSDHPLVYAPVALSGLAIAFNIDHVPPFGAPPADLKLNGQRFTSMKLNPRLVAKLLTQSYRYAVVVPAAFSGYLKDNPLGLLFDPEFLALNPEYKGFADVTAGPVPDALVQLNGADITSQLWSWVKADPDASSFIAGEADPWGMVINPNNKDLPLPTSAFPRNDQSCLDVIDTTTTGSPIPFKQCVLDDHPYANDMHDAGHSASRGDSLARNTAVDQQSGQPVSTKLARQDAGKQALLAVVDAATAVRYGLPTAQLINAAGKFVAPTPESLLAGEAAMKPSAVAGVLASDPGALDPAAYPLTALSYAVTSPTLLDAVAGKDYAAFLRYAGGPGQQQGLAPGLLPPGMVPLPTPLKAQTIAAAATVEAQTAQTTASPPGPGPTAAGTDTGPSQNLIGGSNPADAGGTAMNSGGGPAATRPGVTVPGAGPPANVPSVVQQPVVKARRTPSLPASAVGALLLMILIAGALAATSAPVTKLLGGRLGRHLSKEVTPTEQ